MSIMSVAVMIALCVEQATLGSVIRITIFSVHRITIFSVCTEGFVLWPFIECTCIHTP
jgi:hypothetical protein